MFTRLVLIPTTELEHGPGIAHQGPVGIAQGMDIRHDVGWLLIAIGHASAVFIPQELPERGRLQRGLYRDFIPKDGLHKNGNVGL
jgi:hypothetical protein